MIDKLGPPFLCVRALVSALAVGRLCTFVFANVELEELGEES